MLITVAIECYQSEKTIESVVNQAINSIKSRKEKSAKSTAEIGVINRNTLADLVQALLNCKVENTAVKNSLNYFDLYLYESVKQERNSFY